jgi:hypothetical protein
MPSGGAARGTAVTGGAAAATGGGLGFDGSWSMTSTRPSGRAITTRSWAIFCSVPPLTVSPTEYPPTRFMVGSSRKARLFAPSMTMPWSIGLTTATATVAFSLRAGLKRF